MTSVVAHQYRDEKPQPGLTGCLLVIPAVSNVIIERPSVADIC